MPPAALLLSGGFLCGLVVGGCMQILGEYRVAGDGEEDGDGGGGAASPSGSLSTGPASIPCWFRDLDGVCLCDQSKPNEQYVEVETCPYADYPAVKRCCGFDGWPSSGTCLCAEVRCQAAPETPDYCSCGLGQHVATFVDESSCFAERGEPWSLCCEAPGSCNCYGGPCVGSETETDSCFVDDVASSIACGDGGIVVSDCP